MMKQPLILMIFWIIWWSAMNFLIKNLELNLVLVGILILLVILILIQDFLQRWGLMPCSLVGSTIKREMSGPKRKVNIWNIYGDLLQSTLVINFKFSQMFSKMITAFLKGSFLVLTTIVMIHLLMTRLFLLSMLIVKWLILLIGFKL